MTDSPFFHNSFLLTGRNAAPLRRDTSAGYFLPVFYTTG
jgi:hypothetical protein